ncbi:hypothetical protein DFS34DRAFT_591034 [Phlyctochytrium arcticum]|nr:hypothetical protein DFS34DRAFT_591034 [Phlyctochytrium arcticum]
MRSKNYNSRGGVAKAPRKASNAFKWNVNAEISVPAIQLQAKQSRDVYQVEEAAAAAEPTGLNPNAKEFVPAGLNVDENLPAPFVVPMYIPHHPTPFLVPWPPVPMYIFPEYSFYPQCF